MRYNTIQLNTIKYNTITIIIIVALTPLSFEEGLIYYAKSSFLQ